LMMGREVGGSEVCGVWHVLELSASAIVGFFDIGQSMGAS